MVLAIKMLPTNQNKNGLSIQIFGRVVADLAGYISYAYYKYQETKLAGKQAGPDKGRGVAAQLTGPDSPTVS